MIGNPYSQSSTSTSSNTTNTTAISFDDQRTNTPQSPLHTGPTSLQQSYFKLAYSGSFSLYTLPPLLQRSNSAMMRQSPRPPTPNQNKPKSPLSNAPSNTIDATISTGNINNSGSTMTSTTKPNKKISVTSMLDDSDNYKAKDKGGGETMADVSSELKIETDMGKVSPHLNSSNIAHDKSKTPLYLSSLIREERSSQSSDEDSKRRRVV